MVTSSTADASRYWLKKLSGGNITALAGKGSGILISDF